MNGPILVTGGTGFVGTAVLSELLRAGRGTGIRVLTRRGLPDWMADAGVTEIRGDLAAPATLRGACDGVTTVLHLGSRIGGGAEPCDAVNRDGTRALLAQARRSGTDRVVYLSTTAVYGNGVHRGVDESAINPAPVSATSASKLAAEREIRAFGGVILRPHLVYGPGDAWFIPTLLRLLDRIPAWIDSGAARGSVIAVADLARVVAALAARPWGPRKDAVFHVADPRPVRMRELVGVVCARLGIPPPVRSLPAPEHRRRTRLALPELTDHQFDLLAYDHWYDSGRVWRQLGIPPGPGFRRSFRGPVARWYRRRRAHAGRASPFSNA